MSPLILVALLMVLSAGCMRRHGGLLDHLKKNDSGVTIHVHCGCADDHKKP